MTPTDTPTSTMTPQGYPLECWTAEGEHMLVIGWTETAAADGGAARALAPVAVAVDGTSTPRVLAGPVGYFRPTPTANGR